MKQGKCTNIEGRCSKAISQEVIEYEVTADPECPECGRTLEVIAPPKPPIKIPWKTISIVVLPLLLVGGGIWWWVNRPKESNPTPRKTPPTLLALQDSIRNALDSSRFEEANSFAKKLSNQLMVSNQLRESLIPFYKEVKEEANTHYTNIVVNDKDCNRIVIPFYYYVCAYILSPNDDEAHYVEERRKACEAFAKSNCKDKGISISGGN